MDNLDLGCEQAAEQVLNRARDEELAIAYAKDRRQVGNADENPIQKRSHKRRPPVTSAD